MTLRHITLHCTICGQRKPYFCDPEKDPLPETVETIESTGCDLCNDGGGFVTETWLDAGKREIEQDIH